MSYRAARLWIVRASLVSVGALLLFLLLAPIAGYPLRYDDVPRFFEIGIPVFLSYIGSAVRFATQDSSKRLASECPPESQQQLFSLLVRGPVLVFALVASAAFLAFGYSNRAMAPVGIGMRIAQLSTILTVALSILTVSTSAIVNYLFQVERVGGKANVSPSKEGRT
jgi:hypothetical protein